MLRIAGTDNRIKQRSGFKEKEQKLRVPRLTPAFEEPKPASGGTNTFIGQRKK